MPFRPSAAYQRCLRQRAGRVGQRRLQERADPRTRTGPVEERRGRRTGHPQLGALVQHRAPPRVSRLRSARRVRGGSMPPRKPTENWSESYKPEPPSNPGRFRHLEESQPVTTGPQALKGASSSGPLNAADQPQGLLRAQAGTYGLRPREVTLIDNPGGGVAKPLRRSLPIPCFSRTSPGLTKVSEASMSVGNPYDSPRAKSR